MEKVLEVAKKSGSHVSNPALVCCEQFSFSFGVLLKGAASEGKADCDAQVF